MMLENLRDYERTFRCKISMVEPGGGYVLFNRETEKVYDIDSVPEDKVLALAKQSLASGKNELLLYVLDKEIDRHRERDPNIIY